MSSSEDHTVFAASNGYKVTEIRGEVRVLSDRGVNTLENYDFLSPTDLEAVAEYCTVQEDKRLGRWRSPNHPGFVAYPTDDGVRIVRESDGQGVVVRRSHLRGTGIWISDFNPENPARAYFDAHPEPKPWHDAKPGEVWLLTIDGEEMPVRVFEGSPSFSGLRFETYDRGPFGRAATAITAGRRIWPEVSA